MTQCLVVDGSSELIMVISTLSILWGRGAINILMDTQSPVMVIDDYRRTKRKPLIPQFPDNFGSSFVLSDCISVVPQRLGLGLGLGLGYI